MDVLKNYIPLGGVFLAVFFSLYCAFNNNDQIIGRYSPNDNVISMPLVQDTDPVTKSLWWGAPQADRDIAYRSYLAASLKISVSNASGSGTIIYYDPDTNEAYVTSCGHLWSGTKTSTELKANPVYCKVITWYHNQTKLNTPKSYNAQVLFWSNDRGYDCSLLKFTPDWTPQYFPIAPANYVINPGTHQHSVGCDSGEEVARYDIEIVGYRGNDLITTKNSPRPGRSGGGLLSNDGYYIGTCWGTSDTTGGGGIGYFTPLKSIHNMYRNNGFANLLEVANYLARKIPIQDMNNKQRQYSKEYVPLPNGQGFTIPN